MDEKAVRAKPEADDAGRLDAEAVSQTLSGDLRAYDRLIESYQRRAVAVSYRLLGNINDAMDVCQDAFLKAYRSLATLQEPRRFGPWLMRIVSNLSLNYRRDRQPMLSLKTAEDDPAGVDEAAGVDRDTRRDGGVAEGLISQELDREIADAINKLPEKQRLALVLFAIEGLPQKEVAEILECRVELVKWNVFQARKTLKEQLADYLE